MSKKSLILVLQSKINHLSTDMPKIQIKSEKLTPFGGIFSVMEKFEHVMSPVIDRILGIRDVLRMAIDIAKLSVP